MSSGGPRQFDEAQLREARSLQEEFRRAKGPRRGQKPARGHGIPVAPMIQQRTHGVLVHNKTFGDPQRDHHTSQNWTRNPGGMGSTQSPRVSGSLPPIRSFPSNLRENWDHGTNARAGQTIEEDPVDFFRKADEEEEGLHRGQVFMYQDTASKEGCQPVARSMAYTHGASSPEHMLHQDTFNFQPGISAQTGSFPLGQSSLTTHHPPNAHPSAVTCPGGYSGYYQEDPEVFKKIQAVQVSCGTTSLTATSPSFVPGNSSFTPHAAPLAPSSGNVLNTLERVRNAAIEIHAIHQHGATSNLSQNAMDLDNPSSQRSETSFPDATIGQGSVSSDVAGPGSVPSRSHSQNFPSTVFATCTCPPVVSPSRHRGLGASSYATGQPVQNPGAFSHLVGVDADPTATATPCPLHGPSQDRSGYNSGPANLAFLGRPLIN